MNTQPIIREVTLYDITAIHELSHHLVTVVPKEVMLSQLRSIINSDTDRAWVIEVDGKVRGWGHAAIERRIPNRSFVGFHALVISPDYRRKGLGRMMTSHIRAWANANGYSLIIRSDESRESAHKLFEDAGFEFSQKQCVFVENKNIKR